MKKTSWLQAATIIGFIAAIGLIVLLACQNNQKNKELASLEQRLNAVNRNLVEQQRQTLASAEMLSMFDSGHFKKIKLINVPGKPPSAVHVFWNINTSEVYVADFTLPTSPAHKQYQLWAIVDGQPINGGILDGSKKRVQKMKSFQKADAFAITLERKGGSPTPTIKEIYVRGKVS